MQLRSTVAAAALGIGIAIPGCHAELTTASIVETGDTTKLFAEAVDACKAHSINRATLDWDRIQIEGDELISQGASTSEVMEWLVSELQDGHSIYFSPSDAEAFKSSTSISDSGEDGVNRQMPDPLDPSGRLIRINDDLSVGYIRVTHLISMAPDAMTSYQEILSDLQRDFIAQGASGWVIDLRRNVGGNQWPMLAGLAPILGNGKLGSVTMPTGQEMAWGASDGSVWVGVPQQVMFEPDGEPVESTADWPVAVLTDQRTASSAETIAVSFVGRENTRSFGSQTAGASSANTSIELADGSLLNITTSVLYDRTGRSYGGPLEPDVDFGYAKPGRDDPFPGENNTTDEVLERALEWLADPTAE